MMLMNKSLVAIMLILLLMLAGCGSSARDRRAAESSNDMGNIDAAAEQSLTEGTQPEVVQGDSQRTASGELVKQGEWYLVGNLEDLIYVADSVNNLVVFADGTEAYQGSYKLIGDIDFADYRDTWTPIGNRTSQANTFGGTFDGDGHTIYDFTFHNEDPDQLFTGLFGYIDKATIRNVNMVNCDVSGPAWVGGLAGGVWNTWGSDFAEITNCHVQGRVSGGGEGNTGGVVGVCVLVQDSSFEGEVSITGAQYQVGGVAGLVHGIYGCRSDATVTGVSQTGGVVGSAEMTKYCYALGYTNGSSVVGGVAGESSIIESCYNAGSVSGSSQVGGIVGASSTHYNTLEGTMDSSLKGLLMFGESIQAGSGARICPSIGMDSAVEGIYCRQNLLVDFTLGGTERENGKNFPEDLLSSAEDMQTVLSLAGESWTDHWQPVQNGYLPQLNWESAPPVPIPMY